MYIIMHDRVTDALKYLSVFQISACDTLYALFDEFGSAMEQNS